MLRPNSSKRRGMTLIELSIALGISTLFSILAVSALVVGARIIRAMSNEAVLREETGWVMREIISEVRHASDVEVAPLYTDVVSGVTANNGSCLIFTDTKTNPAAPVTKAYYYYNGGDDFQGGLYLDEDITTPPNPATDELVAKRVLDFEARWDPSGTLRIAIASNIRVARAYGSATAEGNRMQLEATVIPREFGG